MEKLSGKCVLLGVTGGIAAYKMASVASGLRKAGADVHVIMTENAAQFITPLTFETLTNHRCVVDTFARDFQYDVHHISLAKAADLILIAPATANIIAKPRHRGRYADHHGPGRQVPQAGLPLHEYRHAGKPHHPG